MHTNHLCVCVCVGGGGLVFFFFLLRKGKSWGREVKYQERSLGELKGRETVGDVHYEMG